MPVTIINADASQVYRDLRIVSARPSAEEEAEAPHRLFGTIDGATACSAADWATMAKSAVEEAWVANHLPVLVGGTGLYIRTLLDGIAPVPEIDQHVRETVRAMPVQAAFDALSTEDPESAARLSPNDATRVARALEVIRSTGKPISDWQIERSGGIAHQVRLLPLILLPPREWLYSRCEDRFDAMLAEGAVEEIASLLRRNLDPKLPVMRAIGVKEIGAILNQPDRREEFIGLAKQATRNFAKRQYTWFRNQPPLEWERVTSQLDADSINKLVIKLRDMALTS